MCRQAPVPQLLHGREKRVYGDSAYASQKTLMHGTAPQVQGFTGERIRSNGRRSAQVEDPNAGRESVSRLHGAGADEELPVTRSVDGTGAPVMGEDGKNAQ